MFLERKCFIHGSVTAQQITSDDLESTIGVARLKNNLMKERKQETMNRLNSICKELKFNYYLHGAFSWRSITKKRQLHQHHHQRQ